MSTFQQLIKTKQSTSVVAKTDASIARNVGRRNFPPKTGVDELKVNAWDASIEADKMPHAHFFTQDIGECHLFPTSKVFGLYDTALGITHEQVEAFGHPEVDIERHGLGMNGVDGIVGEKSEYVILTKCKHERGIRAYHFKDNNYFRSDVGIDCSKLDLSELQETLPIPDTGPFTMYLVPDWNEAFTMEELAKFISTRSHLYDWEVTINDEEVKPYKFNTAIYHDDIIINELRLPITMDLGIKPEDDSPGIWLIDAETLRKVALLKTNHPDLPGAFKNLKLTGYIYISDLELFAKVDREGVTANFFSKAFMVKLYNELRMNHLDELNDLLDLQAVNEELFRLKVVKEAFNRLKPAAARKSKRLEGTSTRKEEGTRQAQVKLYIRGENFIVITQAADSETPTDIIEDVINIYGGTDEVLRIKRMGFNQQVMAFISLIAAAYATHTVPHSTFDAMRLHSEITNEVIAQLKL